MATQAEIQAWIQANPTASPALIAQTAAAAGVSAQQLSTAYNIPVTQVQQIAAANNIPISASGMFTATPVAAPTTTPPPTQARTYTTGTPAQIAIVQSQLDSYIRSHPNIVRPDGTLVPGESEGIYNSLVRQLAALQQPATPAQRLAQLTPAEMTQTERFAAFVDAFANDRPVDALLNSMLPATGGQAGYDGISNVIQQAAEYNNTVRGNAKPLLGALAQYYAAARSQPGVTPSANTDSYIGRLNDLFRSEATPSMLDRVVRVIAPAAISWAVGGAVGGMTGSTIAGNAASGAVNAGISGGNPIVGAIGGAAGGVVSNAVGGGMLGGAAGGATNAVITGGSARDIVSAAATGAAGSLVRQYIPTSLGGTAGTTITNAQLEAIPNIPGITNEQANAALQVWRDSGGLTEAQATWANSVQATVSAGNPTDLATNSTSSIINTTPVTTNTGMLTTTPTALDSQLQSYFAANPGFSYAEFAREANASGVTAEQIASAFNTTPDVINQMAVAAGVPLTAGLTAPAGGSTTAQPLTADAAGTGGGGSTGGTGGTTVPPAGGSTTAQPLTADQFASIAGNPAAIQSYIDAGMITAATFAAASPSVLNTIASSIGMTVPALTTALATTGLSALGSYFTANAAGNSATTQAQAQVEAARIAADAARLQLPNITGNSFGTNSSTYDANGRLTGVGSTASPWLSGLMTSNLAQLPGAITAGTTMQSAGNTMMNYGNAGLATTPELAATNWMTIQQSLLAPGRERERAALEARQQARGTSGMLIGGINQQDFTRQQANAEQDLGLAARATAEGRTAQTYNLGAVGAGADMWSNSFTPVGTVVNNQNTLQNLQNQPMNQSLSFGSPATAASAASGMLTANGMTNAASTMAPTNAYSPWGNMLGNAANTMNTMNQPTTAAGSTSGQVPVHDANGRIVSWRTT